MAVLIDDFQDRAGQWVRTHQINLEKFVTRSFVTYSNMRRRCSPGASQRMPTYVGCTSNFVSFQSFASWYVRQIGYREGFHLDKDLLVRGNKTYSSDLCVLLPQDLNNLLTKCEARRGLYPVGVTAHEDLFQAKLSVGGAGKEKYLGRFLTPDKAFSAYQKAKQEHILTLAEKYRSQLDPRAYLALLDYRVDIKD